VVMRLTRESLTGCLIDCHSHLGFSAAGLYSDKYPNCYDAVSLLSNLENNGFDYAIVHPFPSYYCGDGIVGQEKNNALLKMAYEQIPYALQNRRIILENHEIAKGRLLFFPMFSLNYAIDEQIDILKKAYKEGDVYGLKYYSDADANEINQMLTKGKRFVDFAIEYNIPITFHTSEMAMMSGGGLSNAMDVLNLAKEVPTLRVGAAHMAHFSKRVLSLSKELRLTNLFFDISPFLHLCYIRNLNRSNQVVELDYSNPKSVIEYVIDEFPTNVLWGSDMPFNFTCNLENRWHNKDYELFSYKNNVAILSEAERRRLCSENAIEYLFGR